VVVNWRVWIGAHRSSQKDSHKCNGFFWTMFHFHKALLIVLLAEEAMFHLFKFYIIIISVIVTFNIRLRYLTVEIQFHLESI